MGRASSKTPWLVALLAALLGAWWRHASSTNRIPAHMLGHTITATPDIMDHATQQELLELLRQFGRAEGGIRTLDKDASSTKPTHEHVGEALPLASGAGAACAHRLMVPSADRSQCTLPQRLDIAKHFLTFGGTAALKERYAVSVGRLLSFGTYIFNPEAYPPIKRLFSSEKFLAAARGVCPSGKQHLDPFQFNIIVQLPGQTVATHIDGAYFWGASRFHVPQWLLAAMVFSGLYRDRFVDQVQVVAYFHEWEPHATDGSGGDFAYYGDAAARPATVAPRPRSGNCVDGSKTVHAAAVYARGGRAPPRIQKSAENSLHYLGGEGGEGDGEGDGEPDAWELRSDGVANGAPYATDDLRLSLVFRARCFEDAPTSAAYGAQLRNASAQLPLEDILETLAVHAGRAPNSTGTAGAAAAAANQAPEPSARLSLAMDIVDRAVHYPRPDALVPWNLCMLDKALPAAEPLVRYFCGE